MSEVFVWSNVPSDNSGDEIQAFANRNRLKTRLDEDHTKIIPGKFGHIHEYDDGVLGVMVIPDPPRKHYWGCVRTTLLKVGFTLVQDGDGEGAVTFNPNNQLQAKAAIRAAGVKRKRTISRSERNS